MGGPLVRALVGSEIDAYCRIAGEEFHPERGPEGAVRRRRRIEEMPGHEPALLRGAFIDGRVVGGYHVEERELVVGPARLLTSCIQAVVTHPEYRRRGVASVLMADAIELAQERRQALILLDAIVDDYYHRFGYAQVFVYPELLVVREHVLALDASPYAVRDATEDDAPGMLALYERHHGGYPGSFVRTLEGQRHRLRYAFPGQLALDSEGTPRGYTTARWGVGRARVGEAITDDWPALLALLHHDAERFAGDHLAWGVRPGSPTFYMLADRLPSESRAVSHPRAGWMARAGHLPTLTAALGDLPPGVHLTPPVLVRLLFAHRDAAWAATQDGCAVPPEAIPLLDARFQPGRFWIPGSDVF